ncbi:MAG: response regulator transcription factor [Chloroflexota bacterium]|nr:MAG: response regulator transcription factor [Chloroflexota bacterium]
MEARDLESVRVLVVDDHALFRDGLVGMLKDRQDMEVVGTSSNGVEAVDKAKELMPDVILMDLSMPGCDGIEATRRIKSELPYVNIAVLTVSENDDDLFEAMRAGAKGYIVKSVKTAELIAAITILAQGHAVITPSMAEKLLTEFGLRSRRASGVAASVSSLSDREKEVLALVGQGLSNRDVAKRLCLSEGTVKTHLRNIFEKLHMGNRIEAAVFAAQQGLLPHN